MRATVSWGHHILEPLGGLDLLRILQPMAKTEAGAFSW